MELVEVEEKYYEFMRWLRNHPKNSDGFLEQHYITSDEQERYLKIFGDSYLICLDNDKPVGYVGVIGNDIRLCTHPNKKGLGIGSFMLKKIYELCPHAVGRIKEGNTASKRLFDKCKVPYSLI